MKKSFSKFKEASVSLGNVYGGRNTSAGTGDCHGTGCSDTKWDGKITDWDDVECGDSTIGKNSGNCDPVA